MSADLSTSISSSPAASTAENELAPTCANASELAENRCRDFRSALGCYATGVTVVTALSAAGEPVGVTISSFNSVSLSPPLILWSLSTASPKLEVFRNASHYAINVLSADQRHLSDHFASRQDDHFAGLPLTAGLGGAPLLASCCAWFECAHEAHYAGGDHLIFVGRVERFSVGDDDSPLIFHGARYRTLTQG
jgi:flavin reductase (DIM6/NTAB) family NADH-FMN oxidoreductase RutF